MSALVVLSIMYKTAGVIYELVTSNLERNQKGKHVTFFELINFH